MWPRAAARDPWLIYIVVADLNASIERCRARGGKVIAGLKSLGPQARLAVIQDHADVVSALYEQER